MSSWGVYPTLGVQIMPEGVYVVKRQKCGGGPGAPALCVKAHIPLPGGVVLTDRLGDPLRLFDALNAWQAQGGPRRGLVLLQMPLGHYVLRTVTLPKVRRRELAALIATEQRLGNLVPLADAALAYDLLDEAPDRYRVAVTAVERRTAAAYVDVFTALGYRVAGVRHPAYGYRHALGAAGASLSGVTLLIVRTLSGDEAILYDRGKPEFIRMLSRESGGAAGGAIDVPFVERLERFTRTTLHEDGRTIERIWVCDETGTAEAFLAELRANFPDPAIERCPDRLKEAPLGYWLAYGALAAGRAGFTGAAGGRAPRTSVTA
ncbi:hypothetical protein AB1399_13620 [Hydrogenibacillus schlegelii]|uniref:Uncharacterized protein n=1 Tax=Hydrogenibacillus schlegelii TaxID=1484 RepID=A0A132N802_HYDSH|nr:hypothetical protein [Hydrogenibacillus schlegelii]KWX06140.1 hypothetical protein TR75_06945 [Hydrogenibacillus schlegelii]OAR04239.1 hypothetical protein SA87_07265 [Hydrogenibacillus schlegelii]